MRLHCNWWGRKCMMNISSIDGKTNNIPPWTSTITIIVVMADQRGYCEYNNDGRKEHVGLWW
jgi:hypothetical protein